MQIWFVRLSLPVPDEVLEKLTVPQLQQIFTFAMEVIDEKQKKRLAKGKVISTMNPGQGPSQ